VHALCACAQALGAWPCARAKCNVLARSSGATAATGPPLRAGGGSRPAERRHSRPAAAGMCGGRGAAACAGAPAAGACGAARVARRFLSVGTAPCGGAAPLISRKAAAPQSPRSPAMSLLLSVKGWADGNRDIAGGAAPSPMECFLRGEEGGRLGGERCSMCISCTASMLQAAPMEGRGRMSRTCSLKSPQGIASIYAQIGPIIRPPNACQFMAGAFDISPSQGDFTLTIFCNQHFSSFLLDFIHNIII
jgi:hypothetical protein